MEETNSFSKQMRIHTRKIHKISDMMVNAKMIFGKLFSKILSNLEFFKS
jgi:hypothetical protein